MRRLITTMRNTIEKGFHLLRSGEQGASMVFVAITLIALFALAAFAIDFGLLYSERRDLQNGADAAALAIAEDCARDQCDAAYDEYAEAEIYVDANAHDGAAWAQQVDLDLGARQVTVYNATEELDGSNDLNLLFASVIGFNNFTVGADATVEWGYPTAPAAIPLIISECEWEKGPDSDPPFPGWPGANPDNLPLDTAVMDDYDSYDRVTIEFHDGNATEDCAAQAGQDINGDDRLPGGFGWLATNGDCNAQVWTVESSDQGWDGTWYAADAGNSTPNGCSAGAVEDLLLGRPVVLIPYFVDIWTGPSNGSGPCGANAKCYKLGDTGAFHVVGYKFSGGSNPQPNNYVRFVDPPLTQAPCTGPGQNDLRCLSGYFVKTVDTTGGGGDLGGEDRGVLVIRFAG